MFTLACCCSAPMFDPEQVLLAVAWGLSNLSVLMRSVTVTSLTGDTGHTCRACRYDLTGLETEGVCPECGAPYRQHAPIHTTRTRLCVDWPRARNLIFPVVFFGVSLFFGRFLVWPFLVAGELTRDALLSSAVAQTSRQTSNGVLYGWLPVPLIMACTPLISKAKGKRQLALITGMLVCVLLLAAAWTPEVPARWRG